MMIRTTANSGVSFSKCFLKTSSVCNYNHNSNRFVSHLVEGECIMPTVYKEAIDTLNLLQSNAGYIHHHKNHNNPEKNISEMVKFLNRSGLSLLNLDSLPIIHVTGTNGKGSTCSYCENILRNHGYKTGFYSSPHLLEVRERIRINGVPISQEKFAEHFWRIYKLLDKEKTAPYDMPHYFKFLTLIMFHVFLAEGVDVAILEVGIGGEFDCTNVVRKTVVAGITPLDLDHTSLLGISLESIAWNKAGIMKPGAQVFTVPQSKEVFRVLQQRSVEKMCTLNVIENSYTSDSKIPQHIKGTNASLALSITKAFMKAKTQHNLNTQNFDLKLAKKSIESARWPGRYEVIKRNKLVFHLDGAHTKDSMQVSSDWFVSLVKDSGRRRVLFFNVTGERDTESLLKLLVGCRFDAVVFLPNVGDGSDRADSLDNIQSTERQLQRSHDNQKLWKKLDSRAHTIVVPSFAKGLQFLENQERGVFDVLVTGSLHLIGAALSILDPTLGGLL